MPYSAALPQLNLVIACPCTQEARHADAARSVLACLQQAELPATVAVDAEGAPLLAAEVARLPVGSELAAIMPLSSESASLESTIEACRRAAGAAGTVLLPADGTLQGAHADVGRLEIAAVVAGANATRRPLPFSVARFVVDAEVPATRWWRRLGSVDARALLQTQSQATIVISANRGGRGPIERLIASLAAARASRHLAVTTIAQSTAARAAARRHLPQQSILRAA